MLMFVFSPRGIPSDYRHQQGFGVNTYKMVNADGRDGAGQVPLAPQAGGAQSLTAAQAAYVQADRARQRHARPPRRHRARRSPRVGAARAGHERRRASRARLRPARRHQGLAGGPVPAARGRPHGARPAVVDNLHRERADRVRHRRAGRRPRLLRRQDAGRAAPSRTRTRSATASGPTTCSCRPTSRPRACPVNTNQRDGQMAYDVDGHTNPHITYEPSLRGGLSEAEARGPAESGPVISGRLTRAHIPRRNDYQQAADRWQTMEEWERDDLVLQPLRRARPVREDPPGAHGLAPPARRRRPRPPGRRGHRGVDRRGQEASASAHAGTHRRGPPPPRQPRLGRAAPADHDARSPGRCPTSAPTSPSWPPPRSARRRSAAESRGRGQAAPPLSAGLPAGARWAC